MGQFSFRDSAENPLPQDDGGAIEIFGDFSVHAEPSRSILRFSAKSFPARLFDRGFGIGEIHQLFDGFHLLVF